MSTATPESSRVEPRITVDVVVHTHWDREWYMDRETTLSRLEAVMERVVADLDAGRLEQFLFDGQTVALEDLTSRAGSGLMARLRAHAQAGRLVLGPWYVASDEFLVSGESLLRNLALGMGQAQALGRGQPLGYLPDTFGHIAQMPQILREFGIGHAVVWRGVEVPHDLFDWRAPDGSSVTTVYLSEGYYLHPLHGPNWLEHTRALLRKLHARRDPEVGGPLLLTHGGDHLAPHPQLQERIRSFNLQQKDFVLQQRTLFSHVQEVSSGNTPRPIVDGELRHNRAAFVLPDVLSTRRYLKRMHQAAEDRLVGQIEPLMAQVGADAADHASLQRAWRWLLQQQAHDSICGCSTDEVHQEMTLRFARLQRALDALQRRVMHRAGMLDWDRHHPHETPPDDTSNLESVPTPTPTALPTTGVFADDNRFTLFNPLPWRRQGWFEVDLFLRGPRRTQLCAVDARGQQWPLEMLRVEQAFELISPLDEFPERLDGHRYTVALQHELAGLSGVALTVTGSSAAANTPSTGRATTTTLDNGAWRVELGPQGELLLTDQRQRPARARRLGILSELDAGDTYNHSPVPGAAPVRMEAWRLISQRHEGQLQELRLSIEGELPEGLDDHRQGASPRTVRCKGELTLRLLGHEPLLRLTLNWHNPACDQRTRLVLGAVPPSTAQTWRDTAFAWTAHPVVLSSIPEPIGRGEAPVSVQPSLSAVAAGPWMLVHLGMHEHEIIPDPWSGTDASWALAVTLVRAVGWMSRRDLRTRGVGAGPDLPTPQAQCLGEDHFDLMLVSHAPDTPAHEALQHAQRLRRPPVALRGHARQWASELNLPSTPLQLSACRRLPDDHLEIRLWNPTQAVVTLLLPQGQWSRRRADGQPFSVADTPDADQATVGAASTDLFTVRPHQLITLRSTTPWGLP